MIANRPWLGITEPTCLKDSDTPHLARRRGRHERRIEDLRVRDGILIGLAQSLALIPGVSR